VIAPRTAGEPIRISTPHNAISASAAKYRISPLVTAEVIITRQQPGNIIAIDQIIAIPTDNVIIP
jgi:hypothetical protein